MTTTVTYTHAGWLGLCPVLIAYPHGECHLRARHALLEWLLTASIYGFQCVGAVMTWLDPEFCSSFPVRVTRTLSAPVTLPVDDGGAD
jgi:hypothetical protein